MLKNQLDEYAKKIDEQVQGQLVNIMSTLDKKIDSTKGDVIGQVHKVSQHVNDLRVEITKVADSLKSKHKEVNESLDNNHLSHSPQFPLHHLLIQCLHHHLVYLHLLYHHSAPTCKHLQFPLL